MIGKKIEEDWDIVVHLPMRPYENKVVLNKERVQVIREISMYLCNMLGECGVDIKVGKERRGLTGCLLVAMIKSYFNNLHN